jgi:transcriptional regulator with XRE-family HTH domain
MEHLVEEQHKAISKLIVVHLVAKLTQIGVSESDFESKN